jgi:hypothetical protein
MGHEFNDIARAFREDERRKIQQEKEGIYAERQV